MEYGSYPLRSSEQGDRLDTLEISGRSNFLTGLGVATCRMGMAARAGLRVRIVEKLHRRPTNEMALAAPGWVLHSDNQPIATRRRGVKPMRHLLIHSLRFMAHFSLALMALGFTFSPASALPNPTVETVLTSNDGTTAVVDLFITMPDDGLSSFSVSVAYDGSLSVVDATCAVAPVSNIGGFCNSNSGDYPGNSPPVWGSLFALSLSSFGVGGDTWHVGTFTFALNGGAGGSVTPGVWRSGVDGFLSPSFESLTGNFIGTAIPEPSSGLLLALGLGVIGMRSKSGVRRAAP